MKSKKHRNKNIIRQCASYDPDFKKAVVQYAEQKSTSEAKKRYGISESNIRRWRKLKSQIIAKVNEPKRKSMRCKKTKKKTIDYDKYNTVLDSMPLQLRISQTPPTPEPILQSQPLSPTKLKVTRQAAKPPSPPPEPPNEEVCLRWNSHHANIQSSFPTLLHREQYVDVTLVAEGKTLKCHRLILSSCSPYFEEVLSTISPFQHPVLFMKDIPFWILKSLCDFMYAGEVHIFQNKLEELLGIAESLKIKGLAGNSSDNEDVKEEKKEENKKQQTTPQHKIGPKSSKPSSTYVPKTLDKDSKSDDMLDPLDLLEPVYEEFAKDETPKISLKPKEVKHPLKKSFPKKLKKRKYSDHEDSPPPVFHSRKGTRSRPNIKVPKYYHTHYDSITKSENLPSESPIERQPHAPIQDPLIECHEIKLEPIDVEDDVELEDNPIDFSEDEVVFQEDEESIVGNYDSPIVNIDSEDKNKDRVDMIPQPIIMNVGTVDDSKEEEGGLGDIDIGKVSKAGLEIIKKIGDQQESNKVTEVNDRGLIITDSENKIVEDPLTLMNISSECNTAEEKSSEIIIQSVQTVSNEDSEDASNDPLNVVDVSMTSTSDNEESKPAPELIMPTFSTNKVDKEEEEDVEGEDVVMSEIEDPPNVEAPSLKDGADTVQVNNNGSITHSEATSKEGDNSEGEGEGEEEKLPNSNDCLTDLRIEDIRTNREEPDEVNNSEILRRDEPLEEGDQMTEDKNLE